MTRVDYEFGLAVGYLYAEEDRRDGVPLGEGEYEVRAEAREAREDQSRSWRAFKLGIARGYRESVRTLRSGKWGT